VTLDMITRQVRLSVSLQCLRRTHCTEVQVPLQWAVIIGASSRFILSSSRAECGSAFLYQLYTLCLFFCFLLSCAVEALCIWEGSKGARAELA
jgi:hypothetical protein